MLDWFFGATRGRQWNGASPQRITHGELCAWIACALVSPCPEEIDVLMDLDAAYCRAMTEEIQRDMERQKHA